METFGLVLLCALVLLAAIVLGWRFATRRYSLPCPPWLDFFLENRIAHAEAAKQIERAQLAPGMCVLDVGCGTGRLAIPAAKRVGAQGKVIALDIQPEMLRKLQARAARESLTNIQPMRRAIGCGEFVERDVFDRAFLTTVLGEIPERENALREIFSALKPGGILSVTEVLVDPHYQSRATVRRLAERAGFRVAQEWGNVLNFTLHVIKPKTA